MSCNTFIPIMDLVREVEALLAANYIDKDDPRITDGVFTNPTIKEGFLLDVQAREEFCRLVQECGLDAPFGKMWLSRPLYPDQMFVSYEDSGEPQTKWRTIQAVLESAGVFGPEATSLSSRLAAEIQRSESVDNALRVDTDKNTATGAANATAISAEQARAEAKEAQLTALSAELSAADAVLQSQIDSVGGGNYSYTTLDDANAAIAAEEIPAASSVDIINDPTPGNNGRYGFDGTTLTKSPYDPLALAKKYADDNPEFKATVLTTANTLDTLETGLAIIPSHTVGVTLLGMPPIRSARRSGMVRTNRNKEIAHQKFYHVNTLEQWERTGDGSGYNPVTWQPWVEVVSTARVDTMERFAPELNLFQDINLTGRGSTSFQGSPSMEAGDPIVTMNTGSLSYLYYPQEVDGKDFAIGERVRLSVDVFSDGVGTSGGDVSIQAIGPEGAVLATSEVVTNNVSNKYTRISTEMDIPPATERLILRFIRRLGNTVVKFKNPSLRSTTRAGKTIYLSRVDEQDTKVSYNLFPYPGLTAAEADYYRATLITDNGEPALRMDPGSVMSAFYAIPTNGSSLAPGVSISASALMFSTAPDSATPPLADISLHAIGEGGDVLLRGAEARLPETEKWVRVTTSMTIPEGTKKILVRLIGRGNSSEVKIKSVRLTSTVAPTLTYAAVVGGNSPGGTKYVAKTGSDTAPGTVEAPYLTIQKAVDSLQTGGNIVVLDSEDYRESVSITTRAKITISAVGGERVNIFGSDRLVLTKTPGFSRVYQAPLVKKPEGMGGARGAAGIFEWGTPSKPIPPAERHILQRGLSHRLPYTHMLEAASKEAVDSNNGTWFWEDGVVYISATDGTDATNKRYEARMRPALTHSGGSIELVRVTSWFSNAAGMLFSGAYTKRVECIAYGAHNNGFSDNANFTESSRDIGAGNGNDGFNGTVAGEGITGPEVNKRISGIYYEPYGHDNGDDGISYHYRSDCTLFGGLFEHNTKADVVHVTGSNSVCYNTESRGTAIGFYTATDPTLDTERGLGAMRCVGTKSTDNGVSYIATAGTIMYCDETTSINPSTMGYQQTGAGAIYATDCKYQGAPEKMKSGNVVVNTIPALT